MSSTIPRPISSHSYLPALFEMPLSCEHHIRGSPLNL
jgi:hypothetical protein